MGRIPDSPEAIHPTWLTQALSQRHPGVRVVGVEITERHEVTNAHAYLRLDYDPPADLPERMFCKMLPTMPGQSANVARADPSGSRCSAMRPRLVSDSAAASMSAVSRSTPSGAREIREHSMPWSRSTTTSASPGVPAREHVLEGLVTTARQDQVAPDEVPDYPREPLPLARLEARVALEVSRQMGAALHVERIEAFLEHLEGRAVPVEPSPLTDREAEVLRAAADGATVARIAKSLHLSEGTVRNYLSNAIGKTGADNRMSAIRTAQDMGWL